MKIVSKMFYLVAFLFISGGCIIQKNTPDKFRVSIGEIADVVFTDNYLRNIFVLTSKSEISFLGYRRIMVWETKGGVGKGFYLRIKDSSGEDMLEEITWTINKEEWNRLKNILIDQHSINEIHANIFNKDKKLQAGLDGTFYMFSGFYDNDTYHFSVHSASQHASTYTLEQKIIDTLLDIVPISPEYGIPSGCSNVFIRTKDTKGRVVRAKKY